MRRLEIAIGRINSAMMLDSLAQLQLACGSPLWCGGAASADYW